MAKNARVLSSPYLLRDGVVVLPLMELVPFESNYRERLSQTLANLPCFLPNASQHVIGGFGALGTPCSFHNTFARELRLQAYATVFPELLEVLRGLPTGKGKIEVLPERLAVRYKGTSPTAEAWHRDTSPNALQGDHVFGGWINFGPDDSYFSCIPGTQMPGQNQPPGGARTGFSTFTKEDAQENRFDQLRRRIRVPPDHLILFYENLIHEVYATKATRDQYRLFHAYRITALSTKTPLVPHLQERFENQAVIPMKSGQLPPMRSTAHWNFPKQRQAYEEFCTVNMNPALLEETECRATQDFYLVSPRFLPSLRELGLPLYPPYTPEEKTIYWPHNIVYLQTDDDTVENAREQIRVILVRSRYAADA